VADAAASALSLHSKGVLSSMSADGVRPSSARAVAAVAIRCFEAAIALQPYHSEAYYNVALAAQQAHIDAVPQQIEWAYRHALALAPRDPKVWSRLVTTLLWDGRYAEAAHLTSTAVTEAIWALPLQRPSMVVSGLPAQPWHEARTYGSLLSRLLAAHDVLTDTISFVHATGRMRPQAEGLQRAGQRWDVLDLGAACKREWGAMEGKATATERKGDTLVSPLRLGVCRLLVELRREGRRATPPYEPLKAQLSTMAPGVHVRPHTGPTNAKLTVHYGVFVPHGASIRVASETRPFVQHGLLVFDDSFEHEVWHNGSHDRTTLVLHVAHPHLGRGAGG